MHASLTSLNARTENAFWSVGNATVKTIAEIIRTRPIVVVLVLARNAVSLTSSVETISASLSRSSATVPPIVWTAVTKSDAVSY